MNLRTILDVFKPSYFGFIKGHSYLDKEELKSIKSLINSNNQDVVEKFETRFAATIGSCECIAYAAGRMGFYDLMKFLKITKGDEVILNGATCSVMARAVIEIGAKPVYSDIDPNTFGSSPIEIERCITCNTKMIVAQHSFGIPCEIKKIKNIANSKNIFLLEDCALTLGSSRDGIVVGNFGNAALFSSDHTKPINTIIGGLVFTKNDDISFALRSSREMYRTIPIKKQYALWRRFLIERRFCNVNNYGKMGFIDLLYSIGKKCLNLTEPFLNSDFNSDEAKNGYAYPAKIPPFLAKLGIYELERWEMSMNFRKKLLCDLIEIFRESKIKDNIPQSYYDSSLDIVPLRFVWSEQDGFMRRLKLREFIHTDWTWFMKPIVSSKEPMINFGYQDNMCLISEKVGLGMINIPCNIVENELEILLHKLKLVFNEE